MERLKRCLDMSFLKILLILSVTPFTWGSVIAEYVWPSSAFSVLSYVLVAFFCCIGLQIEHVSHFEFQSSAVRAADLVSSVLAIDLIWIGW